jgi:hypothetical protein
VEDQLKKVLCLAALAALAGKAATAAVIGGAITGGTAANDPAAQFVQLDPLATFSVGNNTFQDNNLYAFDEDQNIIIPSTISVDVGTNPTAGDVVASHYVFFDPGPTRSQIGYVDFDADIFGIATSTATLSASDFLLNNSVSYLNPSLRGLESGDSVFIDSTDPKRLRVDWTASTPGDYVRVFTRQSQSGPDPRPPGVVPLPAGAPLLLGALGLLALLRRRSLDT